MQVREFQSSDAPALAAIFHASVREGGLRHYSPSQAVIAGMATPSVDASDGARILLERRGFHVEERQDFAINGVEIHNYRMSKALSGEHGWPVPLIALASDINQARAEPTSSRPSICTSVPMT